MSDSASIYVHYPYCLYKCTYCDFNSYAKTPNSNLHQQFWQALKAEINWRRQSYQKNQTDYLAKGRLKSLFLGGGTPSLIPEEFLAKILCEINQDFTIDDQTEITIEVNPGTANQTKLKQWRALGINRLSLGVQSFSNKDHQRFGRIHTVLDVERLLDQIPKYFSNFSLDLMYGFPGQTEREWQNHLQKAISFKPPHLSCYAFSVEPGAIFYKQVQAKKEKAPNPDLQANFFDSTYQFLNEAGYQNYEISNFALKGYESQHNLCYWNYQSYLGLGPGAVSLFIQPDSRFFGYRTNNIKNPQAYQKANQKQQKPFERESILTHQAIIEMLMMGLRLQKGLDHEYFLKSFGCLPKDYFQNSIQNWQALGWMEKSGFSLTQNGRKNLNTILVEMMNTIDKRNNGLSN